MTIKLVIYEGLTMSDTQTNWWFYSFSFSYSYDIFIFRSMRWLWTWFNIQKASEIYPSSAWSLLVPFKHLNGAKFWTLGSANPVHRFAHFPDSGPHLSKTCLSKTYTYFNSALYKIMAYGNPSNCRHPATYFYLSTNGLVGKWMYELLVRAKCMCFPWALHVERTGH